MLHHRTWTVTAYFWTKKNNAMKKLIFKKIDAFTSGKSSGNPAGYINMSDGVLLSEKEMQTIAFELKGYVNEVGFVDHRKDLIHLMYYSAECEVAFCGHATIAILYDLLNSKEIPDSPKKVLIQVKAGILPVYNFLEELNAVFIAAPQPRFLDHHVQTQMMLAALRLSREQLNESLPIRLIDGGLRTLIVPLQTLAACLNLNPDQAHLKTFCLDNDIDIVHVFVDKTSTTQCSYRTRVFAPRFGYLEDPATGSGNAAFGYYLIDEGIWKEDITIEQGSSKDNPNFVHLKHMEEGGSASILFGGSATTRIEGYYYLH